MSATPQASGASTKPYKGRPLGRILIKMGKVNREKVHEALAIQKSNRGPIGRILIDLGYIKEADLQFALAAQIGMEPVNLDSIDDQARAEPDGQHLPDHPDRFRF